MSASRALRMAHLAVGMHEPRLDAVVVIESIATFVQSADRDQLLTGWLPVPGLIGTARLQNCLATIPDPRGRKSCQRFGQYRIVQNCVGPSPAAICRDLHARDPTAAAQ